MIEWEQRNASLHVVDADNTALSVRGVEFDVEGAGPPIDRPVEETVSAAARALQFPHAMVYAYGLGADERYELDSNQTVLELPPDEYVLDIDTGIKTYLRFAGAARLERAHDFSTIVVSFPARRRVVLGFRSRHELPAETVTIPPTPRGIARGLSVLSSSIKTTSPDRSFPTLRGHPPLVEIGEECSIPDSLDDEAATSGLEFVVPPCRETLFVIAPLAYYLQASVRVEPNATPRIRLPERGREVEFAGLPELESDVERSLRQWFFLDCLVRNAGPYGTSLAEHSLLEALEIDAESLYTASPEARLAAYHEVPYAAVEHRLPAWHLSTYVEPTAANARALPYLLDRLSLIFRPQTSTLEGRELVERSLDDFYRGVGGGRQVPSVDIVKPELRGGRVHGWLADGVPIDVFKSTIAAYENRLEFLERNTESTEILVALNDEEMAGERERVAAIYRQRAEDLSLEVTIDERLTTDRLARVFETDHAFVHYIGHCETDGFRCPDGWLDPASVDECRVETFFLNACGSFHHGWDLVERGAVAGAVTFTKVLNDHALKVGSTFAKLLVHGFSFERALALARRRIMMGKDYAVVGDGTHSLTGVNLQLPTTARVERLEDGRYVLELECFSTRETGHYYVPHAPTNEYSYLCGTPATFVLDRGSVAEFLTESKLAVIYDGDVYWSTELAVRFREEANSP